MLANAAPTRFDLDKAARRQLGWWQTRREKVGLDSYGATIAAGFRGAL